MAFMRRRMYRVMQIWSMLGFMVRFIVLVVPESVIWCYWRGRIEHGRARRFGVDMQCSTIESPFGLPATVRVAVLRWLVGVGMIRFWGMTVLRRRWRVSVSVRHRGGVGVRVFARGRERR